MTIPRIVRAAMSRTTAAPAPNKNISTGRLRFNCVIRYESACCICEDDAGKYIRQAIFNSPI